MRMNSTALRPPSFNDYWAPAQQASPFQRSLVYKSIPLQDRFRSLIARFHKGSLHPLTSPLRSIETQGITEANPAGQTAGMRAAEAAIRRAGEFVQSFVGDSATAVNNAVASVQELISPNSLVKPNAESFGRRAVFASALSLSVLAGCNAVGAGTFTPELIEALSKAVLFSGLGGLALLLYGMDAMKDGVQDLAGRKLKRILRTLTTNRWAALGVGVGVTGIVQASSAVAITTVGFVDAELMTLTQALGVIFGTNVGTTATAWIMSINATAYALPIMGLGGILNFMATNPKAKNIGKTLLGLGMIFYGLSLMASGFKTEEVNTLLRSVFSVMSADSYAGIALCILAGGMTTGIIQSSSATVGITMALAEAGVIPFGTAAALVLGENIGTTTTSLFAASKRGTSQEARRVAYAHALFNLIGVSVLFAIGPAYIKGLETAVKGVASMSMKIAASHSAFNVMWALIFTIAIRPFEKMIRFLAPDKAKPRVTHLNPALLDEKDFDPLVGLTASLHEIEQVASTIDDMFSHLLSALDDSQSISKQENPILLAENHIDLIQREMLDYLTKLSTLHLSENQAEHRRHMDETIRQLEHASDKLVNILHVLKKIADRELQFPQFEQASIRSAIQSTRDHCHTIASQLQSSSISLEDIRRLARANKSMRAEITSAKDRHQELLVTDTNGELHARRETSVAFTDTLDFIFIILQRFDNILKALKEPSFVTDYADLTAAAIPEENEHL